MVVAMYFIASRIIYSRYVFIGLVCFEYRYYMGLSYLLNLVIAELHMMYVSKPAV